MRDFQLYQAVLGLRASWTVVNVELDVKGAAGNRDRRGRTGALSVPLVSGTGPGL
ncbi:MAG TPA: hypothetical protein VNK46_13845 [Nitrospiraceae bacterium]|jgi:hypothetical protein|nr:hypothetical protein [Nitrospiraceae bacterium]